MDNMNETDFRPEVENQKKSFRPEVPDNAKALIGYPKDKEARRVASLKDEGREKAEEEWHNFLGIVGENASYEELKSYVREFKEEARKSPREKKAQRNYESLVWRSIDARIEQMGRVKMWEEVNSSASPWKELYTGKKTLGALDGAGMIMHVKSELEEASDKFSGVSTEEREILVAGAEYEIVQLIKNYKNEEGNADKNLTKSLVDDAIKYYHGEGSDIKAIVQEKNVRRYLYQLHLDARNIEPPQELTFERKGEIREKEKKQINTRLSRIASAAAGVAAGFAIWASLQGGGQAESPKKVADKSTPAGLPTLLSTPTVSPTIEAALQTELPTQIVTPTETVTPTFTQTATDLATATETLEPTETSTPIQLPTETESEEPKEENPTTTPPPPTPNIQEIISDATSNVDFSLSQVDPQYIQQAAYIENESNNPNYGGGFEKTTSTKVDNLPSDSIIRQALFSYGGTRDIAEYAASLLFLQEEGTEPSESDIQNRIKQIQVKYGPGYDELMWDLRTESRATTPMTVLPDGKVTFETIAFWQEDIKNNTVNHNIAAEEVLQLAQYKIVAAGLYNDGYFKEVAGINSPEALSAQLNGGHLRAFLELGQQLKKESNTPVAVGNNSYNFSVGDEEVNLLTQDTHNQFASLINEWTGESFSYDDYFDPNRIRLINDKFRAEYLSRTGRGPDENVNIWNFINLRRRNSYKIIAYPDKQLAQSMNSTSIISN